MLAATGQVEAALQQYQDLERRLVQEWAAEPEFEIRDFVRDLEPRGGGTTGKRRELERVTQEIDALSGRLEQALEER